MVWIGNVISIKEMLALPSTSSATGTVVSGTGTVLIDPLYREG
jgi:hypothetical protein